MKDDTFEPQLRVVAVSCLVALGIILAFHGKSYYLLPVYPALVGGGAAWLEHFTAAGMRTGRRGAPARATALGIVVAYGALALPFGLPVLVPAAMVRYAAHGPTGGVTTNTDRVLRLPQDYADMLHWRGRVAAVAHVYDSLPPRRARERGHRRHQLRRGRGDRLLRPVVRLASRYLRVRHVLVLRARHQTGHGARHHRRR